MSPQRTSRTPRPRRGSIYVAVLGVAIILTLIGMMAVTLVRIDRRAAVAGFDLTEATLLSQSACEHSITKLINNDMTWRGGHTHNIWQPAETFGNGSFKWKLMADSGDLESPAGGPVKIVGQGTVNDAVQEYSVYVSGGYTPETGPQELRSYDSVTSISEETVTTTKFWAQYFKPTLPAEATGWKVTSVEIRCRQDGLAVSHIFARLYEPLGDQMPSATMLDTKFAGEWELPTSVGWHTFTFTGDYSHDPTEGMCLAFESTFGFVAMAFEYQSSGVTEADSGFIDGTPTWQSIVTDKAFLYKIHGIYTTETPTEIVTGTWTIE